MPNNFVLDSNSHLLDRLPSTGGGLAASTHTQALVLQEALHHIPNPASDCMVRNVASRLAQSLHDQVTITSCLWAHFVRSQGILYV